MGTEITWDRRMLRRLQKAVAQAERHHMDTFTFDEHEFVLAYAEYLVRYLDVLLPRET